MLCTLYDTLCTLSIHFHALCVSSVSLGLLTLCLISGRRFLTLGRGTLHAWNLEVGLALHFTQGYAVQDTYSMKRHRVRMLRLDA